MAIKENLENIRYQIRKTAQKVGKNPSAIELVGVTKLVNVEQIKEAVSAGIESIGENRVQEAREKFSQLEDYEIKWHLIGHLQKNKVKKAIEIFDMIQSVDSLELAQEIDRKATQINKIMDILIQINVLDDKSKFGISPALAVEIIQEIAKFKNIRIKGLMTIAPLVSNPEDARPYFRALARLRDKIPPIENVQMKYLSMGMSNDFEVAIEEGSNMVRIGRLIFAH